MGFQPMPLVDFEGMHQAKESLISPPNAFETITNGHVRRGRLHKREGYGFKQKLGISYTDQIGTLGSTNYAFNIPDLGLGTEILRPFTTYESGFYNITITATGASGTMTYVLGPDTDPLTVYTAGSEVIQYRLYALADWATLSNPRGTFDWYCPEEASDLGNAWVYPGVIDVTFAETTTSHPTVTYERHIDLPVMGSATYRYIDGVEYNLAFNEKRAWLLNDNEDRYMPLDHTINHATPSNAANDLWSGGDEDYFWCNPFREILVINNGVDAPWKFDPVAGPPQLVAMATNFDGTPGDDIDAAQIALDVLGYLVYFNIKESGTWQRGRARWTQHGNAEVFDNALTYLDIPGNESITSVGVVDGEILASCQSDTSPWWRFVATTNAADAFRWEPVKAEKGAISKDGTIALSDRVISKTRWGLFSASRVGQRNEAPQLGDVPLKWNADKAYVGQSLRYDEAGQIWWSYVDRGETTPLHVVVMQREDTGSPKFSIYDLPFHTLGSYRSSGVTTWDSINKPWDDILYSWDNPNLQGGFPSIIGGDLVGNIWQFNGHTSDQTKHPLTDTGQARYGATAIPFSAKTERLSPFPGQQVLLGWLDILLVPQSGGVLKVKLSADWEAAAYLQESIDIDPGTSTASKRLVRIRVDHVADVAHTIELIEETTGGLIIDGVIPWFKPMGPVGPTA